jgi:hypothetical protein
VGRVRFQSASAPSSVGAFRFSARTCASPGGSGWFSAGGRGNTCVSPAGDGGFSSSGWPVGSTTRAPGMYSGSCEPSGSVATEPAYDLGAPQPPGDSLRSEHGDGVANEDGLGRVRVLCVWRSDRCYMDEGRQRTMILGRMLSL